MKTEVYHIEESTEELEALAKEGANVMLREELGLPALSQAEGGVLNFRPITAEERNVFKILFPVESRIENYPKLIPVQALEALKEFKATTTDHICDICVWDAREYDPDPILIVGVSNTGGTNWPENHYLIARWGSALAPFEELKAKAFGIWQDQQRRLLAKVESNLKSLQAEFDVATEIVNSETALSVYASIES